MFLNEDRLGPEDLQTIDFRLRVRVTVHKDCNAKTVQKEITDYLDEIDGVVEVKEHSWTRHKGKPTIPCSSDTNR